MDNNLIKLARFIGIIPGFWFKNHPRRYQIISLGHLLIIHAYFIFAVVQKAVMVVPHLLEIGKFMWISIKIGHLFCITTVLVKISMLGNNSCQFMQQQFQIINGVFAKQCSFTYKEQNASKYLIIYIFMVNGFISIHTWIDPRFDLNAETFFEVWCEAIKDLIIVFVFTVLEDISLRFESYAKLILSGDAKYNHSLNESVTKCNKNIIINNDLTDLMEIQEALHKIINCFNDTFGIYFFISTGLIFSLFLNDIMIIPYLFTFGTARKTMRGVLVNFGNIVSIKIF